MFYCTTLLQGFLCSISGAFCSQFISLHGPRHNGVEDPFGDQVTLSGVKMLFFVCLFIFADVLFMFIYKLTYNFIDIINKFCF